ncbi:30S ribosomal protein S6 [Candidatus Roizmanbacteria bacterium CG_4_9_14_3_um_filter_33_18]|uniref:Small ribosomal subunit protein bS6 n=3 Tax=Candidatus Roizmaniibacteriota TaxID=1752723 RepID=A0A2M7U8W5_9BACT|nr:MAG: 30S ribosomal protein S6 [Candidatus Roizmanbacteria bacterium CG22_combo_CG10-13_8_21_14_all_34_12]PIZ67666.1 MAG: 30S ribosomal protein S6 [Candidatus Roizmanbacteria bacterium CG_4_10_14_0_2_um_filter_33_96]PJA56076.1 MAG: 30S ribosomal protein S6 [Candidatus Roizmanbacteria bacterium CG_4_9_14_3_um_filter_33_18]
MKYELTFLVKEEIEAKNVKELIESCKGKVTKEDKWGEKTLAYTIKKNHTALFYNFQIEIDKKSVLELKNKLNLNEKILRYLLLVRE